MQLYPAIELRGQGQDNTDAAEALTQAARLSHLGFNDIYVIDRDAQHHGKPFNLPLISNLLRQIQGNAWVGGGIRDAATVRAALQAGASRVVVGPSYWQQAGLLEEATAAFPGKVIALIDAFAGYVVGMATDMPKQRVLDLALAFERAGVAGIVYMEHEREGAQGGLDAEVIADLAFALAVPLYVTGGINTLSDLRALKAEAYTGIAGVILGRALVDGRIDPITAQALLNSTETELS